MDAQTSTEWMYVLDGYVVWYYYSIVQYSIVVVVPVVERAVTQSHTQSYVALVPSVLFG